MKERVSIIFLTNFRLRSRKSSLKKEVILTSSKNLQITTLLGPINLEAKARYNKNNKIFLRNWSKIINSLQKAWILILVEKNYNRNRIIKKFLRLGLRVRLIQVFLDFNFLKNRETIPKMGEKMLTVLSTQRKRLRRRKCWLIHLRRIIFRINQETPKIFLINLIVIQVMCLETLL
jgi:hypothetical protein